MTAVSEGLGKWRRRSSRTRGAPREPLEHRNLAEEVTLFHDRQLLFHTGELAIDAHGARLHDIHLAVQVPFPVNHLPFLSTHGQVLEGVGGHAAIPLRTMD